MVRRWSGERGRGGDGVNGPSVSVVWCVRVDDRSVEDGE